MADAAVAPAAPAKKRGKKTTKKVTSHPKYSSMITDAITALKERGGSSRQAILKYIISTYKVDEKVVNTQCKLALRRCVQSGILKQVKGCGASGSFKIVKPETVKAAGKKPAAKKTTKKPATKKTTKKPAAKKIAKKAAATKKVTKKPAAKKVAKKASTKKSSKKPVAKKATKKAPAKKSSKK
ncbi:histone H1.0-A-like [Panulirus ornatus]|uniref:histone H1.0-A-like n=1 Tax=Panulirus ornatus TaxID=150431 RepID=UPI003A84BC45